MVGLLVDVTLWNSTAGRADADGTALVRLSVCSRVGLVTYRGV
jgi:hypothetical protein